MKSNIQMKSNKKRRVGTISCILFYVLICERAVKRYVNVGEKSKKV